MSDQKSQNLQQLDEASKSSEMSFDKDVDTKMSEEASSSDIKTEDLLSNDLENFLDISNSSKHSFPDESISEEAFQKSCDDMTDKLIDYFESEIEESEKEFQLLSDMNDVISYRFGEMLTKCQKSGDCLHQLNLDMNAIQPYLHKIDDFEENLAILEKEAKLLEQYTKDLLAKFEEKEKSWLN